MEVIAVITDPEEVRKILLHLVKIGRSPPGLTAPGWIQTSCNLLSVSLPAPGEQHVSSAFVGLPNSSVSHSV
jgi:hypothetical protein